MRSPLPKLALVAGVGGWLYEYLIDGQADYMVIGGRVLRIPFNLAYALGAIVWYGLWTVAKNAGMRLGSRVIMYAVGLTVFEWVLGVLAAQTNGGKPLWNYGNSDDKAVYVALKPTLVWVGMALALEYLFK